jgi:uncharacterized protein (DUF924 family)
LDLVHETISLSKTAIYPQALKILHYWFPETLSDLWFGKDDKTNIYIDATFGKWCLERGAVSQPLDQLAHGNTPLQYLPSFP